MKLPTHDTEHEGAHLENAPEDGDGHKTSEPIAKGRESKGRENGWGVHRWRHNNRRAPAHGGLCPAVAWEGDVPN